MTLQFYIKLFKGIQNRNSNIYTNVHSSTIYNSQKGKQPKCLSTNEWINYIWYIHTMEYYSAVKGNEVLIHTTRWIKLENIMLSEISQIQKEQILFDSTCMRYLGTHRDRK